MIRFGPAISLYFLLSIYLLITLPSMGQLPCGQNINFTTWSQEGSISSGQWNVNGAGNSVTQTLNGTSTWFVSPNDFFNVLIQGTIQVNTTNDDDLVGFVFGYQNPIGTLTTPSSTYLKTFIFDWKQASQTFMGLTSNEGHALYEMDGLFNFTNIVSSGGGMVFPELWQRVNSPNLTLLNTNYGNTGWNDFQQYTFQLKYTADSIIIWIDNVKIFEESGCYDPGKFGFYNHSQDNVIYSNFSYTFDYDFTVADSTICVNDSGLFQIGSGCVNFFPVSTSFQWDFGDGSTGQGLSPSHQYTIPGTYNVQLVSTDQFGCSDTSYQSIQVFDLPQANAGVDTFSCDLNHLLTGNNISGLWSNNSGAVLNSPNNSNCSVSVSNPGTHAFIWTTTNNGGCSNSDTVDVQFNNLLLTPTITNPSCYSNNDGQISVVAIGGNSPYTYSWSGSTGFQTTPNATSLPSGTHSVTVTDNLGCTINESYTITPGSTITVGTQITASDCDASNGTIDILNVQGGTGPYLFDWGTGPTNVTSFQNLPSGSYTLTVSDFNNCDTTLTLVVPMLSFDAQVTGISHVSCFGDTNGTINVGGPNPQGNYSYQWLNIPGNPTTSSVNNLSAGIYSVVISSSQNCVDTLEIQIFEPNELLITLPTDTTICEGSTINLIATATGGTPGYNFVWTSPLVNNSITTVSPNVNTEFYCSVTDLNGCNSSDSIWIEVVSSPTVAIFTDTNEACLFPEFCFPFSAISDDSLAMFNWDFGDGSIAYGNDICHTYTSVGVFNAQVTATNNFGCTNQLPVQTTISVFPNPNADFDFYPKNPTIFNPDVSFIDLSTTNVITWSWTLNNIIQSSDQNPSFSFPTVSGVYPVNLIVENQHGCIDSITKIISVNEDVIIYAPNSFTPDGNEHNQTWKVVMSGIDIYSVELSIYNRWGELIWFSRDLEIPWDGTYAGKIVPDGIYTWVLKANNKYSGNRTEFTGHINVLK